MKPLAFDELNIDEAIEELLNGYEIGSEEFELYFDEMEISEEEKNKRKSFAEDFEEMMITIFILYLLMLKYRNVNEQYIVSELESRYSEIASKQIRLDDYMKSYIREFSEKTVEVTVRHKDEEYFTSKDRAILLSENEANVTLNYAQYKNAIEKGYSKKKWITEKDWKVRESHKILDDMAIPINDVFFVGDSIMRFPKDTLFGTDGKEIINCRCSVDYIK